MLQAQTMVTHMMNCGNNRFVDLPFTISGSQASATLPSDALALPDGFYLLTGLVDDRPAVSQIVRVTGDFSTELQTNAVADPAIRVFPCPVQDNVTIILTAESGTQVERTLSNAMGQLVRQRSVHLLSGRNEINLAVDGLAPGMYDVAMRTASGHVAHIKLLLTNTR